MSEQKMPKIDIEGFELSFDVEGSGDPLILIPGFASGAWTWYRQTEELSKFFRVVTFDPRGISNSRFADSTLGFSSSESMKPVRTEVKTTDGTRPEVSIRSIAADAAALLDELGIGKAHVLGASFGGFVAQEFALTFPERLARLVLVCTSFGGKRHVAPDEDVIRTFTSAAGMNSAERIRANIGPAFEPSFAENNPEVVEEVCRLREANPVPEDVYFQQFRSAMNFDAEERAGQIRAETLVVTGAHDVVVPMKNSENLAKVIPNCRLEIIENGGHMFFIEQPEAFNRVVTEFLTE